MGKTQVYHSRKEKSDKWEQAVLLKFSSISTLLTRIIISVATKSVKFINKILNYNLACQTHKT